MLSSVSSLLVAATVVSAQRGYGGATTAPFAPFSGDPFQKYELSAQGINATFIPYGARLTSLLVNDKDGNPQDVAVGYDEGARYLQDTETNHTFFGAVVGRYANRIKNGTFTIDGETSDIPRNEHNGTNTLHGGDVGYDQRNWTVASYSNSSITFTFYDAALEGFPGDVLNVATFSLEDDQTFTSRLVSIPFNDATPIMLSHHIYWALGAYVNEEALTILNDTLYMPYAKRYIQTDGILIPNGSIGVTAGTGLDFTKPGTVIGAKIPNTEGFCGTGCTGIDNAFITDRSPYTGPRDPKLEVLKMSSPHTGIQLSVETDQDGIQIYTCVGQDGSIPVKQSQQHVQGKTQGVEKFGCIVIETQDWIDGINHPEWGREEYQIASATTPPIVNYAKFKFSIEGEK
ncbi:Putative aldose 1-/Glucose-6-phosphate 1-epimerase, galactose mutarotase-like domain superfamily [Septoria linicola]|uniref:Aldose 1-/Glucose-6-phosphate 1-epimerase, galactose mutarotase-like domain superfamily n=1 Tax=Septoria linicola TaxID=215465 RepID=A0A9Q9EGQ5_9PEZI|nr:Putative aldose 1-/Glucose-6-phosphate 1-epimerase, galactose mutarotase-like domain superfamily [Septoria linicola]